MQMIFKFSNDYLIDSFTLVDNLFIGEFMPYAEADQIKVYLYGLMLCAGRPADGDLETMSRKLCISEDDIIEAFKYWEDVGLVKIVSKHPLEVKYLSFKNQGTPPKKYKAEKYADFNAHLQQLFPDRMLTPNEYHEYYNFLESYGMTQNALLMAVQYCINIKGPTVRYPYILSVAKSWASEGVLTTDDVETKLNEYEAQSEEMRKVLKALGRKGGADLEEKQLLAKWTKTWGFNINAVVFAAKQLKSKTFKKLDDKLDEYYRMNIYTEPEMKDYVKRLDSLKELAVKVNKTIGVFYESLEHIIEVYTTPWTEKGFDEEALLTIAHYCFLSGIKTLEGMNAHVNKFYSLGLTTKEAINQYIAAQVEFDEAIKRVIARTGRVRNVTDADREFYKAWESDWGFSEEIILYAAECAAGKTYPMPYINQLLSSWKQKGVKTIEEARAFGDATPKKADNVQIMREYTKEDLSAIFKGTNSFDGSDI